MCSKRNKSHNVKTFNVIANKDEAKAMREHFSCDCKCKLNSTTCKSKQQWNNKICQYECNNYRKCKKHYNQNPSTCIYVNSSYLKSIADTLATECDEIIFVMDIVSTKKTNLIARKQTNAIATNVTSTPSIKK